MNNEEKILTMLENMDIRQTLTDAMLKQMNGSIDAMRSDIAGLKAGQTSLQAEMRESFRQTQATVAEVVDVIGQKIDRLESVVRETQNETERNSHELQVLKSKAQ